MPAKSESTSRVSSTSGFVNRTRRPLWVLGVVVVIGLVVMVSRVLAAGNSASSSTLAPALRLAVGTLDLEGTELAVDSASAAKLLPLWELLAQLNNSGSAAPEEIAATVEAIRLNMSSEQISAIDAMSLSDTDLGITNPAPAVAAAGTQASASAASSPMMTGGDMGAMGAMPVDGGGPMPSSGSQQSTSGSKTSSASPTPAAIQRVIELLKSKAQS